MTPEERTRIEEVARRLAARLATPEAQEALKRAAAKTQAETKRLKEASKIPSDFWLRRVTI